MTEGVGIVIHAHALDHRSNGLAVRDHRGLLGLQSQSDQFVSEQNLGLPLNPFLGGLAVGLGFRFLRPLGVLDQAQFDFANGLKVFVQLVPVERTDFSVEGVRIREHHIKDALFLV